MSQTFTSSGSYTVPSNAVGAVIEAWGGVGKTNHSYNPSYIDNVSGLKTGSPGNGGYIKAEVDVSGGETLYIRFPQRESSEVTNSWSGNKLDFSNSLKPAGGGEAADVRQGGTSLSDRVVVAGGGGGESFAFKNADEEGDYHDVGASGDGGALIAQNGGSANGRNGDPSGGLGGSQQQEGNTQLSLGDFGNSRLGGSADHQRENMAASGNAGSGYYGGEAGQVQIEGRGGLAYEYASASAAGSGGGSNFSSGTILDNQRGNNSGAPKVKITPVTGFPIYIDNQQVKEITIDGQSVSDVTIDGTTL